MVRESLGSTPPEKSGANEIVYRKPGEGLGDKDRPSRPGGYGENALDHKIRGSDGQLHSLREIVEANRSKQSPNKEQQEGNK